MSNCAACGAVLGIGRYCTNCGARVDAPVTTAVTPWPGPERHAPDHRRGGPPWRVLLVGLLVAGVVGAWLVLGGDEPPAGGDPAASSAAASSAAGATDAGGDSSPPAAGTGGQAQDLTQQVGVEAPRHARPGRDFAGRRVTYPPGNMVDGRQETAYRVDGDAAGEVLTFTLPERRTVTMVGLVNGYAKTDRDRAGNQVDWYPRQHRISEVAWVFDDGSRFVQSLGMTREPQRLSVSVETRTIELHILSTRGPGDIDRARDATSISEVMVQGA